MLRSSQIMFINPFKFEENAWGQSTDLMNDIRNGENMTIIKSIIQEMADQYIITSSEVNSFSTWVQNGLPSLANQMDQNSSKSFIFNVNPNKVGINRKKLLAVVGDASGFKTQHWAEGNSMVDFSYSGVFPNLIPIRELALLGIRDPRLSVNYFNLRLFERFYKDANHDVIMIYDGNAWLGPLTSFNYNITGDDPWKITYSFNFQGYPDSEFNLSSGIGMPFSGKSWREICPSVYPETLQGQCIVQQRDIVGRYTS